MWAVYMIYSDIRGVFRTQSNIFDGAFLRRQFTAANSICNKVPSQMFDWVLNTPLDIIDIKLAQYNPSYSFAMAKTSYKYKPVLIY